MKALKKFFLKTAAGFSLIELVVTLSIVILISTVVYANYPDLSEKQSIDRTARLISLTMREAETRAMTITEDPFSEGFGRFPAYGVHFDISLASGSNKKFILYSDFDKTCTALTSEKCRYIIKEGANDKIIAERIIPTAAVIKNLCGNLKSLGEICGLQELDITFLRPSPTIYLKGFDGVSWQDFNDAEILVDMPAGTKKNQKLIGITQSGQIFIENDSIH